MSSWLVEEGSAASDIKHLVKQCVAVEYTPVSEWSQDSSLSVLIQHKHHFEWMDISHAIPKDSDREYAVAQEELPKLTKLPARAKLADPS